LFVNKGVEAITAERSDVLEDIPSIGASVVSAVDLADTPLTETKNRTHSP
jgi:hypothetical protein